MIEPIWSSGPAFPKSLVDIEKTASASDSIRLRRQHQQNMTTKKYEGKDEETIVELFSADEDESRNFTRSKFAYIKYLEIWLDNYVTT